MNKPRILFMNVDYQAFLDRHYAQNPGLERDSYVAQMKSIFGTGFGDSDHWARGMRAAGWDAEAVIVNNARSQGRWALEHQVEAGENAIIIPQIQIYKPDVLFAMGLWTITPEVHEAAHAAGVKVIAGHFGSYLDNFEAPQYDIIFTVLPYHVDQFREAGVNAHYLALACAPQLMEGIEDSGERLYPVTFIGSLGGLHKRRVEMLKGVAEAGITIDVWSSDIDALKDVMGINYHGNAWGREAMKILSQSRITLNCHIDHGFPYVGNMRMYEATCAGALLITDWGENLEDLFVVGRDLVAYKSTEGCVRAIKHYLSSPVEATMIAKLGKEKTRRIHTYEWRMVRVAQILEGML